MTYQILCEYLYRQQVMTDNGFSEMKHGLMIEGKSNLVLKDIEQNSSFVQSSLSICPKLQDIY